MRLGDERESSNVEDQRDFGGRFGGGGAGFGRIGIGGGLGGVVLVVVALLLGVDPTAILSGTEENTGHDRPPIAAPRQAGTVTGPADPERRFVAQVLAITEDVWTDLLAQRGQRYDPPKLVLFSGQVRSACGIAGSAVGPFYCPGDQRLYIDLDFLADLQRRLGAPGDFAAAYVIAHEVGHHVQTELGITERVAAERQRSAPARANALSVKTELQADCFAGVWANRAEAARAILEAGDVEEGINAAAAVGDDRLQRRAQGYVVPESFTHGSSAERVRWFRQGLSTGDPARCDTFAAG